jgi:hypothetical protein
MARPLRIEYDGALYHITSRGNERRPIFKVDTDRNNIIALKTSGGKYNISKAITIDEERVLSDFERLSKTRKKEVVEFIAYLKYTF